MCDSFEMTKPYILCEGNSQYICPNDCVKAKSYINEFYDSKYISFYQFPIKYHATIFSMLDNYLEDKPRYPMKYDK